MPRYKKGYCPSPQADRSNNCPSARALWLPYLHALDAARMRLHLNPHHRSRHLPDTLCYALFIFTSGYLESSPGPGCQFPAYISQKNTGEISEIILFNEYDESEWWWLITNHDNSQFSSSFDPVSSPSNHLLKNHFFYIIFISDSTVLRKMYHFDISFVIWKLSRSRELTKPTLLDLDQFPGSPCTEYRVPEYRPLI